MGLKRKLRELVFRWVSERRKYPRVPLSVKVTKIENGSFQYCQASNISAAGLFIKASEPLSVGVRLRLAIALPRRPIEVEGMVIRVMLDEGYPSGMGVKFDPLPEEKRQLIEEYVAQEM